MLYDEETLYQPIIIGEAPWESDTLISTSNRVIAISFDAYQSYDERNVTMYFSTWHDICMSPDQLTPEWWEKCYKQYANYTESAHQSLHQL